MPGHHENVLARYPVLHAHDGSNLSFPEEAFAGETRKVGETPEQADAMNLIRKVIVVGVQPLDRMADHTMPGYEAYGRYLADGLRPWIDAGCRTLAGPGDTGVLGSSLGRVVSMHPGLAYPATPGSPAARRARSGGATTSRRGSRRGRDGRSGSASTAGGPVTTSRRRSRCATRCARLDQPFRFVFGGR